MIYLRNFSLMSQSEEESYLNDFMRTCYDSYYPFLFFPNLKELSEIEFDDITIFSGSNGSGKSTLLNIIAECLKLERESPFNKTHFFDPYIEHCHYEFIVDDDIKQRDLMRVSRIITSDDVFKHIIEVRERNDNLDFKRELIFLKGVKNPRGFNADDPESIKAYTDFYDFTRLSHSKYVRKNVGVDERTYSNGENGFKYFTDAIRPGGLYLLDEPENSLSAEMQLELSHFILNMARFYKCQFILSTHSPFILYMPFARIYNLDEFPVKTCRWTDLPNIRLYYDFFKEHSEEFEMT